MEIGDIFNLNRYYSMILIQYYYLVSLFSTKMVLMPTFDSCKAALANLLLNCAKFSKKSGSTKLSRGET